MLDEVLADPRAVDDDVDAELREVRGGPTPERRRIVGVPTAPADRMTLPASIDSRAPSRMTSTPTARVPSKRTRSTVVDGMIVRLGRPRAGSR